MLTLDELAGAEALLGVSYTPAERALMLDNFEAQIGWAIARRGVPLGNDAPTACRFDPRLPTTVMPPEQACCGFPTNLRTACRGATKTSPSRPPRGSPGGSRRGSFQAVA